MVITTVSTGWFGPQTKPPAFDVSLGDFRIDALSVTIHYEWYPDATELRLSMRVPAIAGATSKAGEVVPVHCSHVVMHKALADMDRAERGRLVKRELLRLIEHEIEEKLVIDGEYAFDPHNTGRCKPKPKPAPAPVRADSSARYPRSKRVAGRFPPQELVTPKGQHRQAPRQLRAKPW